jgi:hypothetical protein
MGQTGGQPADHVFDERGVVEDKALPGYGLGPILEFGPEPLKLGGFGVGRLRHGPPHGSPSLA